MQKLAEHLMEKYLSKIIFEKVSKICLQYFDEIFREYTKFPEATNSTLGSTFENLKLICEKEITIYFENNINDMNAKMLLIKSSPENNPYSNIVYDLWRDFTWFSPIDDYIELFINELRAEKREELINQDLINESGDYLIKL